jgi:hypothetical protein
MFSLTEEQIAFIENDIKIRGITSPDLSIDLLDHICCLIENTLDGYRNFDTVYQETLLLFGEKGLKEIQDETNRLLTFKHYTIMNKTMKISGYISSVMILLGAYLKFQHWPGASMLLIVGTFFFTVLFLPLLFILKFKSSAESNRSIVLSIIGFVAAMLICFGMLFRIMHWPGAKMEIILGCALLIMAYLPVYFISVYKNTTDKINATATVIFIIAAVGLIVTETSMGIPKPTSDTFWRGVTESNDLLNFTTQESNNVYAKLETTMISDSAKAKREHMLELKKTTDDLMKYIHEMKVFLIANVESISEADAEKLNLDALRTEGDPNYVLPGLLLDPEHTSPEYTAEKLKNKLDAYKQALAKITPDVNLANLNTGNINVYGEEVSWEQSNFDQLPIPLVVYNIIRIELSVKTTEQAALNQL